MAVCSPNLLKKSYDLPSTVVAMLDFGELQEFPKMSSWATLLKCTLDQQFMEHFKLCHMHHHRKPHIHTELIHIKVIFDLDFGLGSHK